MRDTGNARFQLLVRWHGGQKRHWEGGGAWATHVFLYFLKEKNKSGDRTKVGTYDIVSRI